MLDNSIGALFKSDSIRTNGCLDCRSAPPDEVKESVKGTFSKRKKVAVALAFSEESIIILAEGR